MSEQDQQRPLTRRELREREMGETRAPDASGVFEASQPAPDPTAVSPSDSTDSGEIEISPLNEDGTPRSRREMRELREQANAERAARDEQSAAESSPAIDEGFSEAASTAADPEPVLADDATPPTVQVDFDSLISPPTEPFTVEELRAAERAEESELYGAADAEEVPAPVSAMSTGTGFAEASVEVEALAEPEATVDVQDPAEPATPAELDDVAEVGSKAKRRFWQRGRAADAAVESEEVATATDKADSGADVAVEVATDVSAETDDDDASVDASLETTVEPEVILEESAAVKGVTAVDPEPVVVSAQEPTAALLPEAPQASDPESETKTSYSFPDIAPPEEWRSVFDDPATRSIPSRGGVADQGDFDDLISRAVAQEGAAGATNTSALILPSMPEDTGGLTGPLGGTGELYVTGSLKLPKSLGETGGHSSMLDSIELDPITGAEASDPQTTGQSPMPVSARSAVSARMDSSIPVVAKPAKEHSKVPLILSLTGGGLLIVVVALGIWGANNGMFS